MNGNTQRPSTTKNWYDIVQYQCARGTELAYTTFEESQFDELTVHVTMVHALT